MTQYDVIVGKYQSGGQSRFPTTNRDSVLDYYLGLNVAPPTWKALAIDGRIVHRMTKITKGKHIDESTWDTEIVDPSVDMTPPAKKAKPEGKVETVGDPHDLGDAIQRGREAIHDRAAKRGGD